MAQLFQTTVEVLYQSVLQQIDNARELLQSTKVEDINAVHLQTKKLDNALERLHSQLKNATAENIDTKKYKTAHETIVAADDLIIELNVIRRRLLPPPPAPESSKDVTVSGMKQLELKISKFDGNRAKYHAFKKLSISPAIENNQYRQNVSYISWNA